MKKTLLLCIVISLLFFLLGCTSSATNSESNYPFVTIQADYPYYSNIEDIMSAASHIYVGTVKSISFEIIDMKTGEIDESPESKSSSRMLYTIYTISVKTSVKGDNPAEVKIGRTGGLKGYNEKEQFEKMQKSGLLSAYDGIPLMTGADSTAALNVGSEYLFCTRRPGEHLDIPISPGEFAHKIGSNEANSILKASK